MWAHGGLWRLVIADLGRAAVLASVPLAYAIDALTIAQLYATAVGAGTLTVFFDVAYQSYLPSLVERRQLVDGNAKVGDQPLRRVSRRARTWWRARGCRGACSGV